MTNEIMIAGFGGQGVMAIGKTLAEAGMKEGKDVLITTVKENCVTRSLKNSFLNTLKISN